MDNYIPMPSPSKAKGSSWERDVALHLTGLYGETFTRVPNSGAYIGGKNTVRKQHLDEGQIRAFKGDIIPGASFPALNIECKSYKDFPFHQLYQGQTKILEQWIDQLMEVADEGDFNILIMKFNRKGKFIAFQAKHRDLLKTIKNYTYYISQKYEDWFIVDYDQFWLTTSDQVRALCQRTVQ